MCKHAQRNLSTTGVEKFLQMRKVAWSPVVSLRSNTTENSKGTLNDLSL